MKVLECGHVAIAGSSKLCRHLFGEGDTEPEFYRVLTGRGVEWDLRCRQCDAGSATEAFVVCEGCVARVDEERDFDLLGWRGSPGIVDRLEPLDTTVLASPLPSGFRDAADIAPVSDLRDVWLLLGSDGRIARWDLTAGTCVVLADSRVPDESGNRSWAGHTVRSRLHCSADGRFAAVVHDFGRHGAVFDLSRGKRTMVLDSGGYHEETVPFSFAFVQHAGRTVAIHRTGWNRLDASDPATGGLLTDRVFERGEPGAPPPEHYLDYFHGSVLPSPDGGMIADDGWVWSPVGMCTAWSITRWLGVDVWESEDGPTRRRLTQRAYNWNVPMCWIDAERLAVWGIGVDDEAMLDGVEIYNVEAGVRVGAFAGPRGGLFADARRLYSAGPGGLEIWDPDAGERTGAVPGFVPSHHHSGSAEFAALVDGELRRWRPLAFRMIDSKGSWAAR